MKKISYILLICFVVLACEEILLEDDISDVVVKLVAPVDNAEFTSTGITFTWEPIEIETKYQIQIARPNFENPLQIVTNDIVETASYTTQLNIGQYQWRVRAINSGFSSAYSIRSITVLNNEDFQSNTVTLISPNNETITNTASQILQWEPIIGATSYHLQIVDITNTIKFEDDIITDTNYVYSFSEGNYHWKIRASNGTQNTLYSSRSILIDTTVPNTPILTNPANLSNTSNNDVTFQWSRIPVPGSTETDSIYIYNNKDLTILNYKNLQTSPYNISSLENGTYYWFVKSFDEAGNTNQQSSVFSFTLN